MKNLLKLATLLTSFIFYVGNAHCSCVSTGYTSIGYINVGNIIVQRDTPAGTTLATVYSSTTGQQVDTCTNGGNEYTYITYPGASSTAYPNVYSTNIPGIGIRAFFSRSAYASPAGVREYISGSSYGVFNTPLTLEIIKTGATSSGSLITGQIVKLNADSGPTAVSIVLNGGSVTSVACSITTSNVNVPLDPVLASSFTSVNSTKGDKPFTIGLECDAGARINASLSFTQNTGTSNNSVIQLTGAGTAGVATGVGIQLLYGSTILKNNTNVVLKTSTGGQEFPAGAFTARYFQTAGTVTTGDANATATLNLTYQ